MAVVLYNDVLCTDGFWHNDWSHKELL